MRNSRIRSRGLLIVGLVAALCAYGLAAQGSADRNQGAAAGQGQATSQPRAGQAGSSQQATAPQQQAPSSQTAPMGQAMTLARTSELIGKDIKNPQGESLGTIHDIVLSQDHQQVSYVAVSSGAAVGMGRTFHAIPWQALQVGPKGQATLAAARDQFQQMAGFSNDNWPSQGNPQWLKAGPAGQGQAATSPSQTSESQGQAATGRSRTGANQGQAATGRNQTGANQAAAGQDRTSPNQGQAAAGRSQTGANQAAAGQGQTATSQSQAAGTASQMGQSTSSMGAAGQSSMANQAVQMRRVTHLIGMAVRNPQNQDLGDIEDFAINVSDGRIIYHIIAFGGVAGIGEKLAAVPASAVRFQPQTHAALLNATPQTLESAVFRAGDLASLSSREQMQRLSKLFPAAPAGSALGYVPPSSQTQSMADERAWGADSQISKSFNASNVKTIKGTVESVGTFMPEGAAAGASSGLRLRVKTADGSLATIHAGPSSYAEKSNFFAAPGDEITITGSESKIGSRSVIVASELRKGSQTLQLRDKSGKPLWTTTGQPSTSTPPGMQPGTSQKPGATNQSATGQSGTRTRQP